MRVGGLPAGSEGTVVKGVVAPPKHHAPVDHLPVPVIEVVQELAVLVGPVLAVHASSIGAQHFHQDVAAQFRGLFGQIPQG